MEASSRSQITRLCRKRIKEKNCVILLLEAGQQSFSLPKLHPLAFHSLLPFRLHDYNSKFFDPAIKKDGQSYEIIFTPLQEVLP